MKTDLLIDAIGEIDDNKINSAKMVSVKTKKRFIKPYLIIVAAIILCFTITVPVLASTVTPVYELVYQISPELAQMLKPVQMSCEDNGIKMEVISASVYENEAAVYISLQDMTDQNRIDATTDLYDSYHINQGFRSFATCSNVSFDKETGKATFLINITRADGNKIEGNKITLNFTEFISKKNIFDSVLLKLDLNKAVEVKETFTPEWFCGSSGIDGGIDESSEIKCLVPLDGGLYSPVDGVTITNMGFIDNKLHIQVYYDSSDYDDHGFISLRNNLGKEAEYYTASFYEDDEELVCYEEMIYDITPDDIKKYTPYGFFVTCKNKTEGFWQVTFPLEDINPTE